MQESKCCSLHPQCCRTAVQAPEPGPNLQHVLPAAQAVAWCPGWAQASSSSPSSSGSRCRNSHAEYATPAASTAPRARCHQPFHRTGPDRRAACHALMQAQTGEDKTTERQGRAPNMSELEKGLPGMKYSDGAPAVPVSISRSRTVYLPAGSLISWFSAREQGL